MSSSLDTFSAVVVDDEPLPRTHLAHMLSQAGVGRVIQAASATECLEAFDDEDRPDWVFLDIRMPGLDGLALADAILSLAEQFEGRPPAIVFVTGHEDYAVQAFERDAVDYLLKPVERARLALTLQRLVAQAGEAPKAVVNAAPLQKLPIRMEYMTRFLDVEDIVAAAASNKRVEIITKEAAYTTYYTLAQLEQRLPQERFCRVHDAWIVNIASVVELHNLGSQSYQIRLSPTNRLVPVSRRKLQNLQRLLGV